MKLSDIKGEKTLDVIADLVAPVANIALDEEASDLFVRKLLPEGMKPWQFFAMRAKKAIPKLLKTHKDDLVEILSTIAMVSKEEYLHNMSIPSLVNDITDLLTDDLFGQFFTTAQTEGPEESSGAVQENTQEEA